MKIKSLPQYARNARRFKEIVFVLVKYGFANWIKKDDPEFIKSLFRSSEGISLAEKNWDIRIRMALAELGATFIKLGQILSTRNDIVGPELAKELTHLQSNIPADPYTIVKSTIENEFNQPVNKLYESFEEKPLASASIGQVHKAILNSGEEVVVKVQHSNIEEKVKNDLDILLSLAELAENNDEQLKLYQPYSIVKEFGRGLQLEVDFQLEKKNLELIGFNLAHHSDVVLPEVYPALSSKKVLTMTFLGGQSINNLDYLREEGINPYTLSDKVAQLYLDMIFRDNVYHADPHSGNIRILPDGKIALLDFGRVGRLDARTKEELEEMIVAVIERDDIQLTDFVMRIGSAKELDRDSLRSDISIFIAEHIGKSFRDFNLSNALEGLTKIIRKYHVMLPSNFALLIRVLLMLEGTLRYINPDFNLASHLEPYYKNALQRHFSPEILFQKIRRSYRNWDRFLEVLPRELSDILQKVRTGKLDINMEHHRLDLITNRLVYGILTASLFLGSSIVLAAKVPPAPYDISILGMAGCVVAFILGARLFWSIKKSGDLD